MYRRIRDLREDSDLTQKSLADYHELLAGLLFQLRDRQARRPERRAHQARTVLPHECGLSCGAHGGAGSLP